jgi:hypothetical protein
MVNSSTPTEMPMMVIGLMIKPMVMVYINIRPEQYTKDSGKTICNMAMERSHGQMVADTMDNTRKATSMVSVLMNGRMVASTVVNGSRVKYMV